MALIKSTSRSASVAFAPDAPYIVAGTIAGAVDLSFNSSANLEIFKLDFQSEDRELAVIGECPSSERFNRLAWGKKLGSDGFALGLVAGGLVDGNIDVWNPLTLIGDEKSENALVGHLSRHKGPVRGLEFNAFVPNHLASGADDGEICIWDLVNPSEPIHFPPLKGTGSASQDEISFLSWNSKVQHILASTSYNGTTVVWDLKKQKPVISFSDSVKRRCSVLQWHPDVATQLVVASDEDDSPCLKLWDMRNVMTPVKTFAGHTKGVIAMSWCPFYSSYLLTCAKDNRTICWDTISGEIVCELPLGSNWSFDVQWYPRVPGVISACSFDGKVGIYNIEGCSRYGVGENDLVSAPLRAPKWYKRPVGASFGFGGKLVSFRSSSSNVSEIYLHKFVTEDNLVSRSSEFEAAVQNGERSSLRFLCEKKSREAVSEEDRETWGFLNVMFEDNGTARTKLLTHLGFSLPIDETETSINDLLEEVNCLGVEDKALDKVDHVTSNTPLSPLDNGEDFFNNLPSPKADTLLSKPDNSSFVHSGTVNGLETSQEELDGSEESTESFDDNVQRALVVGDYKGAVAQCISANKWADALVISHIGSASLGEHTRDQYLSITQSPYSKIVSAMVSNDLLSVVNTRPLKYWKETLALLCSFAQRDEWTMLCDTLASKLVVTGNTLAATLCYICAGNIDKTVELWSRNLKTEHNGKSYVDLLQDLMEKTIVLALATGQKRFSASLYKLVEKYAEILASQGLLTTAIEYIKLLGTDELTPELLILRERISLSIVPKEDSYTSVFENSQQQGGAFYGAENPNYSASYYQEPVPSHMHKDVPRNPCGESYQQPSSSSFGSYVASTIYHSAQQASMFVPSQAPVSQPTFTPSSVSQPSVRPFVPNTPPVLRNAEQYQQPTTLGSQLYPVILNPHQPGPLPNGAPGSITSQASTTQNPRGFMPVHGGGVAQRPLLNPGQPPSPTAESLQPAPPPPALAPTVQTADTANVPVNQKSIVGTLTRLYKETSEAMGGVRANPAKKREIEDNSKKLGGLFAKLNSGDISKNASDKLLQLCEALDNRNFGAALEIQGRMAKTEWDECQSWLGSLKRMIKTTESVRLN